MSFFEDKLYQFIEELGNAGIEGHDEVKEREQVFEKSRGTFETAALTLNDETDESLSRDSFSSRRSPARLGLTDNASKWSRVRLFLIDLMDYSIERKGTENQEYWRKMDDWEFEGKLVWKNRSHLRLNRFSWDEAR